jgi:hypothetical protein
VLSREEIEVLDGVDLDRALLAAEARARASQREMADILDVAERRTRHRADGHRNVRGWLLAFTRISGPEATARIQTMRAMRELPHAAGAFREGSIGVCQMRLLARLAAHPRVGDLLPAVERKLVRKAAPSRSTGSGSKPTTGRPLPMPTASTATTTASTAAATPPPPPTTPSEPTAPASTAHPRRDRRGGSIGRCG